MGELNSGGADMPYDYDDARCCDCENFTNECCEVMTEALVAAGFPGVTCRPSATARRCGHYEGHDFVTDFEPTAEYLARQESGDAMRETYKDLVRLAS
jgi:hypothetical protein